MIKPYLLMVTLSLSIASLGQTSPADSLMIGLTNLFHHFQTDSVPTGRIYERGLAMVHPGAFTRADSAVETNLQLFGMAYQSMSTAQVNERTDLPSYHNLLEESKNYSRSTLPLFFMNLDYNYLHSGALADGLVRMENEAILPIAPVSQILGQSTGCLLAPARPTVVGPQVTIVLPSDFWVQDTEHPIVTVELDLGNGQGWQNLSPASGLQTQYTGESGNREIQYRVTSGGSLKASGRFKVFVEMSVLWGSNDIEINPTLEHDGAFLHVEYSAFHTGLPLQNPVIVLEGWDPKQIAPLLIDKNMDWQLLRSVFEPIINNLSFDHDIIYVDYKNGTDYIERNAALLEDVLAWVNANKQVGHKNVVIGHSMGGLVARYCLSKMAKEGHDSQTRLLITHDSPHQGANTPIGLQYLSQELVRRATGLASSSLLLATLDAIFPYRNESKAVMEAPATKQMLLYSVNSNQDIDVNTWLGSTYKEMISFPSVLRLAKRSKDAK